MTSSDVWNWLSAHDWMIVSVVTYVLLNVGPRPHPENLTGWRRGVWLVIDRLAVLSAEKVPGDWKWIFAPSPPPPAQIIAAPSKPPPPAVDEPRVIVNDPPKDPKDPPAAA